MMVGVEVEGLKMESVRVEPRGDAWWMFVLVTVVMLQILGFVALDHYMARQQFEPVFVVPSGGTPFLLDQLNGRQLVSECLPAGALIPCDVP